MPPAAKSRPAAGLALCPAPWHDTRRMSGTENSQQADGIGPGSRVLITGAAGFVGSAAVRLALEAGWLVRAMVREEGDAAALRSGGAGIVAGDLTRPETLVPAAEGVDAVIHCAATTSEFRPDAELSRRTNIEGTRALVEAALRSGRPRWIQISSMSAHPASTSIYGTTKHGADEVVRASGLPWTILKPSIIYGPGGRGVVARTVRTMRGLPVMPVVGDGKLLMRPVHADDVARAALACLANGATAGREYMIGGPDEITFNEFLEKLGAVFGVRRRRVRVPIPVAMLIARTAGAVMKNPPLTTDNVLGVREALRVDISAARSDFGFSPVGFDQGLEMTREADRRDAD